MTGGFPDERSRNAYLAVYDTLLDWPVPAEEITVETRFGTTHVRRSGPPDGVPLVLLHGVLATSLSWQEYVEPLARRCAVYAVDSLGEPGRSVQTAPMPDAGSVAGWLAEVLAGFGLDRAHLAGISRGGWLALNLACRAPERVASVTAFDPLGLAPMGMRQYRWMAAGLAVMLAPRCVRRRFGPGSRYSAFLDERHRRLVLAQWRHRTTVFMGDTITDDQWRSIPVPVTLVLGGRSPAHDAGEVRRKLAAVAPGITVDVIPGAGHGMDLLRPDLVVERILRMVG
ncbi:pimeloyl-ACP methyl ester carboxylesterase [Prauserella shujinwangii]|uniref:Pimeloyl-ACP methyl ester carboxylesterase n=1 Tax=Prauserella shujinwangii TaxID=1453103 RepID=A0A2T0M431_9PSEU|nr:alpha/beta fold hydrolase [Prauserella shujinwangii]PRX51503.1 pimeloyl-ACP methyl ester carboxylesterase [Prauserella shujinwangii]